MRDFLRTTLWWVILAFVGDSLVAPVISIGNVAPDFSIIALVTLALAAGATPATVGGFVMGLVQDLANPTLLGVKALSKTGIGYGLGRLRDRLVYGVPIVEGFVLFLASLAHDFVFLLVQSRLSNEAFLLPFVTQAVPVALYTGLVGIPILRLADFFGVLRRED